MTARFIVLVDPFIIPSLTGDSPLISSSLISTHRRPLSQRPRRSHR